MKKVFYILALTFLPLLLSATHQRAAEITYTWISGYTYKIKITSYTYTESEADRPLLTIHWGDGANSQEELLRADSETKIYTEKKIKEQYYYGTHSYPGPGSYKIWFEDENRNGGIINMPNSVNTSIYVETYLTISAFISEPNNSPTLLNKPVDEGCVGVPFVHNPGAVDPDGDSLAYQLISCKGGGGANIPGYTFPTASHYFGINAKTGDILWDSPINQGEYNIAFLIKEYRKGFLMGSITRDMQINVRTCSNKPPKIDTLYDTCIVIGQSLQLPITARDPDNGNIITLTAVSDIIGTGVNDAHFTTASAKDSVTSLFSWLPECRHVREQPYAVYFKATDNGNALDYRNPNLSDMKTLMIKVVAPPPVNFKAATSEKAIGLSWNKYSCTNATGYKIYRTELRSTYSPEKCETGVKDSVYTLIATITNINTTIYNDYAGDLDSISPGMTYCYKITATFANNVESISSIETCNEITRLTPIILNVSVDSTDTRNGRIFLKWKNPNRMDTISDPSSLKYYVTRSINKIFFDVIDSLTIPDSTFLDKQLNTDSIVYYYKIELWRITSAERTKLASTKMTSSIFLSAEEKSRKIKLTWKSLQPWPTRQCVIYKSLNKIDFDSIGTTIESFYEDTAVMNNTVYHYKIKAYGAYNSPNIENPLINFSQIIHATPHYSVPCAPQLSLVSTACEPPENIIKWVVDEDCANNIAYFKVFFKASKNDNYDLLDTTVATTFIHKKKTSIVGCYVVKGINPENVEGSASNEVCVDYERCFDYSLPNVFSPNNDGVNDVFKAYPHTFNGLMKLYIYNRWGNLVFDTTDPDFQWDGVNKSTKVACSDGAYFYVLQLSTASLENTYSEILTGSITILR